MPFYNDDFLLVLFLFVKIGEVDEGVGFVFLDLLGELG